MLDIILFIFVIASLLTLGIIVFFNNPKNKVNRNFTNFMLWAVIWIMSNFLESEPFSPTTVAFLLKLDFASAAIIGHAFLLFCLNFPVPTIGRVKECLLFIPAGLFAILSFSDLIVRDIGSYESGLQLQFNTGPLFLIYTVYYFVYIGAAITSLIVKRKQSSGVKKAQISYVLLGTFLSFATAVLINLVLSQLVTLTVAVSRIGIYGLFFLIGFTSYAIIAHRLMDINVVITKGLAYGALTGVIAGAYIGLMMGVDRIFTGVAGYNPAIAHALLFIAVLFALIYVLPQMKIRAIEITRRAIFRGKYDYQQELSEATRIIPTMLNLEQLGSYILTKIRDTMAVDKIALLTYTESEHAYSVLTSLGLDQDTTFKVKIGENSALAGLLRNATTPLVKEEMEKLGTIPEQAMELALKHLDSLGAELCVPLMVKEDLTGILTLSNKRTGEMFSEEDLSLLSTIANQVALTIEYIKAVDRIVSEQRYVGLGKAAMRMAHDIKNPLVPLKTFLQILPDKYPKEFSKMSKIDAEFTGRFYESALEGVDRINLLIERALHYARHPQPAFSPVELASLLDDVLIQEEVSIKKAKIELQKQYDSADNNIKADGDQLIELFSNLIGNSIDAMEDSPVKKLTVKTQGLTERVAVEITDTGCGIPKQRIGTIFDPFITYKHKGSGLGLAIAKKIVDDHKGIIELKSEPGKGTTFRIILPRKHEKT